MIRLTHACLSCWAVPNFYSSGTYQEVRKAEGRTRRKLSKDLSPNVYFQLFPTGNAPQSDPTFRQGGQAFWLPVSGPPRPFTEGKTFQALPGEGAPSAEGNSLERLQLWAVSICLSWQLGIWCGPSDLRGWGGWSTNSTAVFCHIGIYKSVTSFTEMILMWEHCHFILRQHTNCKLSNLQSCVLFPLNRVLFWLASLSKTWLFPPLNTLVSTSSFVPG